MTIIRGVGRPVSVLYLDIDGTVRHGPDELGGRFVNRAEDVTVFAQAVVMMRRWRATGGRIVGVSNQGGVALGLADPDAVAAAMVETNRQTGGLFDKMAYCCHHPNSPDPETARCWCRKPSPGLVIEAANELAQQYGEYYPPYRGLMVGDRPEDEQCARLAGLDFINAATWRASAGPAFLCPVCLMVSVNPHDVDAGYCGACHEYTGKPAG